MEIDPADFDIERMFDDPEAYEVEVRAHNAAWDMLDNWIVKTEKALNDDILLCDDTPTLQKSKFAFEERMKLLIEFKGIIGYVKPKYEKQNDRHRTIGPGNSWHY